MCTSTTTATGGWRLAELSCLCGSGNASAGFADDVEALEAAIGYNQQLLTRRTTNAFVVAIAVAALPILLCIGRAGWRRRPAAVREVQPIAQAKRESRIAFAFFQAGWAILVITCTPFVMVLAGQSIDESVGNHELWAFIGLPLSFCMCCGGGVHVDDGPGSNGGAYGGGGDGGGDGGGCGGE